MSRSRSRPFVVARRADQLGGRLSAIVNASSLAKLLGLESRFVWPRGPGAEVADPRLLFTPAFLDAFEIQASDLADAAAVPHHKLAAVSGAESGEDRLDGIGAFVEVNEIFAVVQGAGESSVDARRRYRRCFAELGWTPEVRRLLESAAKWPAAALPGVHIRFGDIVTGEWRHVVAHEKYVPTPLIEHTLEHLTNAGRRQVLALSDHDAYLAWLADRFPSLVTAPDVFPGYTSLPEVHRALVDILLLSRCDPIVGPPSSAFSRLAGNLGRSGLRRADMMIPHAEVCEVACAGIERWRPDTPMLPFWRGLLARDIAWTLDVFGDTLALQHRYELARWARELEPDFVGAQTRFARVAALAGEWSAALDASATALAIAETVDRHDDPLMEALCTDIAVRCTAVAHGYPLGPVNLAADLARCGGLRPVWLARDETTDRREIFEILGCLIRAADTCTIDGARATPLSDEPGAVGDPGDELKRHRNDPMYDPLIGDLRRIAHQIEQAK